MTIHPAFAERVSELDHERRKTQAAELYEQLEPAWHAEALCRSGQLPDGEGPQRPGATWELAFPEDAAIRDPEAYASSRELCDFMAMCTRCPVRRPCLSSALAAEAQPIELGSVWYYVSHEPGCADNTCEGCIIPDQRLRYKPFAVEPMPAGVFGGVPGKIRGYLAEIQCPTCEGRGHERGFFIDGVDVSVLAKGFKPHENRNGWPCEPCGATGRIPNPDHESDCLEWLGREAARQGWDLDQERTLDTA